MRVDSPDDLRNLLEATAKKLCRLAEKLPDPSLALIEECAMWCRTTDLQLRKLSPATNEDDE